MSFLSKTNIIKVTILYFGGLILKKILLLFTFIILIILSGVCVYAKDTKYKIDDIDMTISFDDSMVVFTKDTSPDYKYLSYTVMTYEELMDYMDKNNICLQAQTKDSALSMAITYQKNDAASRIFNLSEVSEENLQDIINEFTASKDYLNCKKHYINEILYLYMDFSDSTEKGQKNGIQYYTIINGFEIIFTVQTTEDFSDNLFNDIESIMNTVTFDNIEEMPQKIQEVSTLEKVITIIIEILLSLAVIMTIFIIFVAAPRREYKQKIASQKRNKFTKKYIYKSNNKNSKLQTIQKLSNKRKLPTHKENTKK